MTWTEYAFLAFAALLLAGWFKVTFEAIAEGEWGCAYGLVLVLVFVAMCLFGAAGI